MYVATYGNWALCQAAGLLEIRGYQAVAYDCLNTGTGSYLLYIAPS
ncbi:hypothetical protein GA0115240_140650 [Streptomyces sp. DvalAA-14]|nr:MULTISPECIES: hypothetical protein [unclassified Streptomyces]MYS22370.1 hypothetical protein [Streptomyces sp. SID4948]SCE14719.1 hypothetical protein GA0115240_140650 [Streptomyces sp. DvalAA-14]